MYYALRIKNEEGAVKRYSYLIIALIIITIGYYGVNALFTKSFEIPTTSVTNGEFVIGLNTTGRVDATRAVTLSTPRIRGLQITWLAPEGIRILEDAPVIKFDASKQITDLADRTSELKIKKSALERAKKEYIIQEKQLTLNLEKSRRNYDEKKYDAPRIAEEARMEKDLAELNFEAKLEQLKADVEKAEVEVQRARDKESLAQREFDQMTINAPIPGLVVYLEIWKGGTMDKVQEGDSPWPGQGLINLPDLDEMKVDATVSEVDANKVDSGQLVEVVLDAFPLEKYEGVVTSVSTLARKKESGSKINVFDVIVAIKDHDEKLKPGMSASCNIIIDRIQNVISVPFEAVFEKDGKTVVYLKNKKEKEVTVGQRNDMDIEIIEGLDGDEIICLLDPTLDEQGLPGDRATEPELNKGNSPQKKTQDVKSGDKSKRRGNKGK